MSARDDECWDCPHTIASHSGQYPEATAGCLVDDCPCKRWYEVQPKVRIFDISVVSDPLPEYEFKVDPVHG